MIDIDFNLCHPDGSLQPIRLKSFRRMETALKYLSSPPEMVQGKLKENGQAILSLKKDGILEGLAVWDDGVCLLTRISVTRKKEKVVYVETKFLASQRLGSLYELMWRASEILSFFDNLEALEILVDMYLEYPTWWPTPHAEWKPYILRLQKCVKDRDSYYNVMQGILNSYNDLTDYKVMAYHKLYDKIERTLRMADFTDVDPRTFFVSTDKENFRESIKDYVGFMELFDRKFNLLDYALRIFQEEAFS